MTLSRRNAGLQLAVLDFWPSIGDTIELAVQADQLGYSRYWLTEHPPQPSPQMLVGILGGLTQQIRVGAAGVLAHFHNPLRTALDFQLLESLYPGRIDLGFCGGAAEEPVARALLDGGPDSRSDAALFARRCSDLVGFARREFPAEDPRAGIAWPAAAGVPELWSLGTGARSALFAAERGLAFGYSLFHHFSRDDTATVRTYRDAFQSHPSRERPLVSIAVAGTCAGTARDALIRAALHANECVVPTIIGNPALCREQIEALADRYGADVVAFLDVATTLPERIESHALLAEACGINRPTLACA